MAKDYFDMEVMKYWSYPKGYKGDINKNTEFLVKTGQYVGAKKVDGEHARFIRQKGKSGLLSRTRGVDGKFANKLSKVPHLRNFLTKAVPDNSILVGELFLPDGTNSSAVGSILRCLDDKAVSRQTNNTKLHFYIFDIWAWNGEEFFNTPIVKRLEKLKEISPLLKNPYIEIAEDYEGEKLWDKIGEWLNNGEEGAVLTKKTCIVYEKRTPAFETIKIKKELLKDIDVFFTGKIKPPVREYTGKNIDVWQYWQNTITGEFLPIGLHFNQFAQGEPIIPVTKNYYYSIPGSFEIGVWREGEIFSLGYISGVTDELKQDFLDNPQKYVLKPCQVSAMEIGNDGGLRHPKFICFRDDLDTKDCTFEKVYGHK